MRKGYYIKYFLCGLVFWIFVVSLLAFVDKADMLFLSCLSAFGFISAAFFPFAMLLTEQVCPALLKPTHWGRWVGLVLTLFSVPLGLIYFIVNSIKKRNNKKKHKDAI